MEEIYQIYDRIFKRIFTLSNLAIINLINGLFNTNYSPDSTVTYPNKEFVNSNLKRRFADLFITINELHTYHIEAQMEKDQHIILRVFEYCFYHANENAVSENTITTLSFPEPVVIYLDKVKNIPPESKLLLDFKSQGTFIYKVKNYFYQDHDIIELNQKKMIILIPFQLLKLRNIIKEHPTEKNFLLLQQLIQNDIIGSIEANLRVGNISTNDATELMELVLELHEHIYAHYYELGGCEAMKPLLDGAIELPLDKYRIRIDELEELEKEKDAALSEKNNRIKELEERLKELEALLQK